MVFAESFSDQAVWDIAQKMALAARTAPKARGTDLLVIAIADKIDLRLIAEFLKQRGEDYQNTTFLRDAQNLLQAQALFLIGTKIAPLGLKTCGHCGFATCDEKRKYPLVPCVFNTGDLGIALGSAVSVAADHRLDNRILYSAGRAVIEMALLGEEVKIAYAVPLAATAKNPFFDRKA